MDIQTRQGREWRPGMELGFLASIKGKPVSLKYVPIGATSPVIKEGTFRYLGMGNEICYIDLADDPVNYLFAIPPAKGHQIVSIALLEGELRESVVKKTPSAPSEPPAAGTRDLSCVVHCAGSSLSARRKEWMKDRFPDLADALNAFAAGTDRHPVGVNMDGELMVRVCINGETKKLLVGIKDSQQRQSDRVVQFSMDGDWRVVSFAGSLPEIPTDAFVLSGVEREQRQRRELMVESVRAAIMAMEAGPSNFFIGVNTCQAIRDGLPEYTKGAKDGYATEDLLDAVKNGYAISTKFGVLVAITIGENDYYIYESDGGKLLLGRGMVSEEMGPGWKQLPGEGTPCMWLSKIAEVCGESHITELLKRCFAEKQLEESKTVSPRAARLITFLKSDEIYQYLQERSDGSLRYQVGRIVSILEEGGSPSHAIEALCEALKSKGYWGTDKLKVRLQEILKSHLPSTPNRDTR